MLNVGGAQFVVFLVMLVIIVIPFWKIFVKAGFPGALSLLILVPAVNVIMIFFLAFAPWPALRNRGQ